MLADAAPPVGTNRLRLPQPPLPFTAIRNATAFGPACPQFKPRDALAGITPPPDSLGPVVEALGSSLDGVFVTSSAALEQSEGASYQLD